MNAWLTYFAELLDLVRDRVGREPTDDDLALVFAAAAGVDAPPSGRGTR